MHRHLSIHIFLFFTLLIVNVRANNFSTVIQDSAIVAQELRYDHETIIHSPLDQSTIESYQNDDEFNYKEVLPEDNWWTRFKAWLNNVWRSFLRWIFGSAPAQGFWADIINIIPYLLGIGLLVLMIWLFNKMDGGQLLFEKSIPPQVALAGDEELLQREDIQELINNALANKNHRLAVRFYYLLALQKLSTKQLINWQVQKTNHDYIFELSNQNLRQQFRRVTNLYDYIWYGNFEVDEAAFAKAETAFKTLNSQL